MNTKRIAIIVDKGLPERSGRINSKTWQAVKSKRVGNGFFDLPEGKVVPIGTNPFEPSYLLFVVDDELPVDSFVVSSDVKKTVYPTTDYLEI